MKKVEFIDDSEGTSYFLQRRSTVWMLRIWCAATAVCASHTRKINVLQRIVTLFYTCSLFVCRYICWRTSYSVTKCRYSHVQYTYRGVYVDTLHLAACIMFHFNILCVKEMDGKGARDAPQLNRLRSRWVFYEEKCHNFSYTCILR